MKNKKLVFGVGINDVDYAVRVYEELERVEGKRKQRLIWECPDYKDWQSMLERGYSEKCKQKYPTYKDSTCIEEWLRLSLFKEWKADYVSVHGCVNGKQLDKDIIVPRNKIYNPDTCAYVSKLANTFVVASDARRGEWPIGVCWHKTSGKFVAQCNNPFTKKNEYLGLFTDHLEAHEAWRQRKHELAQLVAETESDPRVVESLKKRYSFEEWYKNNPTI